MDDHGHNVARFEVRSENHDKLNSKPKMSKTNNNDYFLTG